MNERAVEEYLKKTKGFTAEQIIEFVGKEFEGRIKFASSLGEEDQVITDIISKVAPEIPVFTLDTGRLFTETYDLIAQTQRRYPIRFEIYYPDTKAVEQMVQYKGINLFYDSIENRKQCCGVRKIEPLKRALESCSAWMTGLRKAQSLSRAMSKSFEWDEPNQRIKVNPLVDWSLDQLREYVYKNQIDVNPLHKKGFVSIGCSPCTRAIKEGDDIRAGRWWWEDPDQKECGLHNNLKMDD